jgi:hypothetical protein
VGREQRSEPRTACPDPTSIYIALPQGPTNHIRLDAPDQGARGGVDRVVGLGLMCDQSNSLWIKSDVMVLENVETTVHNESSYSKLSDVEEQC